MQNQVFEIHTEVPISHCVGVLALINHRHGWEYPQTYLDNPLEDDGAELIMWSPGAHQLRAHRSWVHQPSPRPRGPATCLRP